MVEIEDQLQVGTKVGTWTQRAYSLKLYPKSQHTHTHSRMAHMALFSSRQKCFCCRFMHLWYEDKHRCQKDFAWLGRCLNGASEVDLLRNKYARRNRPSDRCVIKSALVLTSMRFAPYLYLYWLNRRASVCAWCTGPCHTSCQDQFPTTCALSKILKFETVNLPKQTSSELKRSGGL